MTDQITRLLDDIEQLDQYATPGPWVSKGITPDHGLFEGIEVYREGEPGAIAEVQPIRSDAELVALSRTALPDLAQAVRAVLKECESFEIAHDDPENAFHEGVQWTVKAILQTITDTLEGAD